MKKNKTGRPVSTAYGKYMLQFKKDASKFNMGNPYSRYQFNKIYKQMKENGIYKPTLVAKYQRQYKSSEAKKYDIYAPINVEYNKYLNKRAYAREKGYGLDPVMGENEFIRIYNNAKAAGIKNPTNQIYKSDLSFTRENAIKLKNDLSKRVDNIFVESDIIYAKTYYTYIASTEDPDVEVAKTMAQKKQQEYLDTNQDIIDLQKKYSKAKDIQSVKVRQNLYWEYREAGYSKEEFEGIY